MNANDVVCRSVARNRVFLILPAVIVAAALGGAWSATFAQTTPSTAVSSDYAKRVVAYINETEPVSRQQLGEYLIDRLGAEGDSDEAVVLKLGQHATLIVRRGAREPGREIRQCRGSRRGRRPRRAYRRCG